jgi:molybdate/tungstate transport system substrate-binding protein
MDLSRRSVLLGTVGAGSASAVGLFAYGQFGAERRASSPSALVAGSLLRVARSIPDAQVEAHGSATVRQLVLTDQRDPDAVALADPRLFAGISSRATLFASNALVIAYHPDSEHAAPLRRDWKSAIGRADIDLGRTDPDSDPLGYRTVMALRLAAENGGVDASSVLDRTTVLREVDVLNVLEQGGVGGAFVYRNMAVERDLPYVELPDSIDFSNPSYADEYASASYELPEMTVRGAPIRYAATALTVRGEHWVETLVTDRRTLRDSGFVVPAEYPIRDHPVAQSGGRNVSNDG